MRHAGTSVVATLAVVVLVSHVITPVALEGDWRAGGAPTMRLTGSAPGGLAATKVTGEVRSVLAPALVRGAGLTWAHSERAASAPVESWRMGSAFAQGPPAGPVASV